MLSRTGEMAGKEFSQAGPLKFAKTTDIHNFKQSIHNFKQSILNKHFEQSRNKHDWLGNVLITMVDISPQVEDITLSVSVSHRRSGFAFASSIFFGWPALYCTNTDSGTASQAAPHERSLWGFFVHPVAPYIFSTGTIAQVGRGLDQFPLFFSIPPPPPPQWHLCVIFGGGPSQSLRDCDLLGRLFE